jgi:hypothetical protein
MRRSLTAVGLGTAAAVILGGTVAGAERRLEPSGIEWTLGPPRDYDRRSAIPDRQRPAGVEWTVQVQPSGVEWTLD